MFRNCKEIFPPSYSFLAPGLRFFILSILLTSLLPSCVPVPKIIVLHDPLTVEEHLRLGITYSTNPKEAPLAIRELERVLEMDKKNLSAHLYLGHLYYTTGQYGRASFYFKRAYRFHPDETLLLNNLAWIAIIEADYKKAELLIKKALSTMPDKRYIYLDTLLQLYIKENRRQEAARVLTDLEQMTGLDKQTLLSIKKARKTLAGTVLKN